MQKTMETTKTEVVVFEDYFPEMVEKLGADGFMKELCKGFRLLTDNQRGDNNNLITFDSLKKNSELLGLQDMSEDELNCMLKEGDLDGDGALNQMEFCVLMCRLSPGLMSFSQIWFEQASVNDLL